MFLLLFLLLFLGLAFNRFDTPCLYHLRLDHPGLRRTGTTHTGLGYFWGLHTLKTPPGTPSPNWEL
jgi:hypothetical protein